MLEMILEARHSIEPDRQGHIRDVLALTKMVVDLKVDPLCLPCLQARSSHLYPGLYRCGNNESLSTLFSHSTRSKSTPVLLPEMCFVFWKVSELYLEVALVGCYGKFARISAWVSRASQILFFKSVLTTILVERPIRSFELLTDVTASWNSEKTVNVFLAKETDLQPRLSRAVSQIQNLYSVHITESSAS